MKKQKPPKPGKKINKSQPKSTPPAAPRSWWSPSRILAAIISAAAIVGIVPTYLTFVPRVTVAPFGQFDPTIVGPQQFNITDSGNFELSSVEAYLGICHLRFAGGIDHMGDCPETGGSTAGIHYTGWDRGPLASGGSYTISVQDVFRPNPPASIANADITIGVTYPVPFTWWHHTQSFRRVTKEQGNSKLYWFEK